MVWRPPAFKELMAISPGWAFWDSLGPSVVDHRMIAPRLRLHEHDASGLCSGKLCPSAISLPHSPVGIATHTLILRRFGWLGKGVDLALSGVPVDLVNFGNRVKNGQSGITRGGAIGLIGPTEGLGSVFEAPF
jgi:hypothetical protein